MRGLNAPRTSITTTIKWDDDEWDEGDLEIVSADGYSFRVPRDVLRNTSDKFRNFVNGSYGFVRFHDPAFETGHALRRFLELQMYGEIAFMDELGISHIFAFCHKWDLDACAETLRKSVWRLIHAPSRMTYAATLFAGLAMAGEDELCVELVGEYADQGWGRGGAYPRNKVGATARKVIWDTAHWPLWLTERCPPRYRWALTRAWQSEDFPSKFAEYLELAGAAYDSGKFLNHNSRPGEGRR